MTTAELERMTQTEKIQALAATIKRAAELEIPVEEILARFHNLTPRWKQWARDVYAGRQS